MAKKITFINYFRFFLLSLFVAFVVSLLAGLLMGYRYILVNGWSAQQKIPYQSFILVKKCDKSEVYVNDFATTSLDNEESYLTHQVIGIKYDGYFQIGECFAWELSGIVRHSYYGYQSGNDHDITALPGPVPSEAVQAEEIAKMHLASNIRTDCNLITMANDQKADATKDYRNFETEFVGKVVWYNYTLGKTIFILKDESFRNRVLLLGLISCVVMVFVMSGQTDLHIGFFD